MGQWRGQGWSKQDELEGTAQEHRGPLPQGPATAVPTPGASAYDIRPHSPEGHPTLACSVALFPPPPVGPELSAPVPDQAGSRQESVEWTDCL